MEIIDSHIHCGVQHVSQPFSHIQPLLDAAGIRGACLFAPVEDIYDRYHPHFDDNETWVHCRARAHAYLLNLAATQEAIFPYYFVWNDFLVEDLERGFVGIKWHHHAGEPVYHYDDPRCEAMINAICRRRMPIVLEETFRQTLNFLERINGRTPVIIPHLGMLNGGFHLLMDAGIWEDETVYADTALASEEAIAGFVKRYGPDRLLFGSDYPFGEPGFELERLFSLGLPRRFLEKICAENILALFHPVKG